MRLIHTYNSAVTKFHFIITGKKKSFVSPYNHHKLFYFSNYLKLPYVRDCQDEVDFHETSWNHSFISSPSCCYLYLKTMANLDFFTEAVLAIKVSEAITL